MNMSVAPLPEVLKIAGYGMFGIFIVTGMIILGVEILNKLTAKK